MSEDVIVWDEKYSVGFPLIDDQHKKLVDMINALFELDKSEDASKRAAFAKGFSKAGEYTQTHFHDEEQILEKAGYPELAEHKKLHQAFMNGVWEEFSLFNKGSKSASGLPKLLMDWLLTHIAVADKKYVPYLK